MKMCTTSTLRLFVLGVLALVCMICLSSTSVSASLNAATDLPTVPVLFTSTQDIFLNSTLDESEQPSMAALLMALQKGSTSKYINSQAEAVKQVIMLVYDELSLDDFGNHYSHFNYLLPALNAATSAMMFQTESFAPQMDQFSTLFNTILNIDCVREISTCKDRLASLSHSDATTNQLIVIRVSLNTPASSLSSIFSLSKDPSTVLIVTSVHSHPAVRRFTSKSVDAAADPVINPDAAGSSFVPVYQLYYNTTVDGTLFFIPVWIGPQYITPNIFFGLLLGLFLLFVLYQAILCMTSIQRPVRLSAHTLVIAKEY